MDGHLRGLGSRLTSAVEIPFRYQFDRHHVSRCYDCVDGGRVRLAPWPAQLDNVSIMITNVPIIVDASGQQVAPSVRHRVGWLMAFFAAAQGLRGPFALRHYRETAG